MKTSTSQNRPKPVALEVQASPLGNEYNIKGELAKSQRLIPWHWTPGETFFPYGSTASDKLQSKPTECLRQCE